MTPWRSPPLVILAKAGIYGPTAMGGRDPRFREDDGVRGSGGFLLPAEACQDVNSVDADFGDGVAAFHDEDGG